MYARSLMLSKVPAADTSEAVAVTNPATVSSSTSDSLLDDMTLTPGAGDYLVWFTGSLKGDDHPSTQYVSIYAGGTKIDHTERIFFTEGSIPDTPMTVATQAYVTGVGASDKIEVYWHSDGHPATATERTLMVQKVTAGSGATFAFPEDTKYTNIAKSTTKASALRGLERRHRAHLAL